MQHSDITYMKTAGEGRGLVSAYKVNQPFVLNGKTYYHEFLVVNSLKLPGISAIIGFDLIEKLNLVLRAGAVSKVYLEDREVPIQTQCASAYVNVIKVQELKPVSFSVNDDVCVPANATLNVCVETQKIRLPENQLLLLNPHPKFNECAPSDMLVKVHEEKNVYLTLYNYSAVNMFVPQGTIVAFAEPVTIPTVPVSASICTTSSDFNHDEFTELIHNNTNPSYIAGMLDIANLYRNQFVVADEQTGFTDYMPFTINTANASPISQRPYRVPVAYEADVNTQLIQMQRDGIISLSKSPWASPMVVVKKKDKSLRLCVDYRKLNAVTEADSFPLPSIEELLLKVRNSKFFSTLDLKSGYHQVAVATGDQQKTAFLIQDRLFEYNTLPFGLRNAPSHFSRLMSSILANVINTAVLVYLDDIIILGSTVEEHAANIIKVLEILKTYNLKCSLHKYRFFQSEVEFLGHSISPAGIRPLHDKIESMRNFPVPRNAKEVNSFLGLCSYYRKFIRGFAEISRPLDKLRKVDTFQWDDKCQEAFDKLRTILSSTDILMYPKFDRTFIVTCDASATAIGGVVSQIDDFGNERPVSFCSRALKGAEINYSATDREALAIKYTLERHRYFLLGYKVKIKSDHQALKYLFLKSDLSSRHARWLDSVLEFQIEDFEYITGSSNRVADALSRGVPVVSALTRAQARAQAQQVSEPSVLDNSNQSLVDNVPADCDNRERSLTNNASESDCTMPPMHERMCEGYPLDDEKMEWDVVQLIRSQDRDPIWSKVKKHLRDNSCPFPVEVRIPKERFLLEDEILYVLSSDPNHTNVRTVLTPEFAKLALELVHCATISGHMGLAKTLKRAKTNFYWYKMDQQIKTYVKECELCAKFKGHRIIVPPARQWPIAQEKFYRIHVDLIGPLPLSITGDRYIFVACDALTRYTFTDAMPDKTAITVAKSFVKFINTFGCPHQLVTDQGKEFLNNVLSELNKLYNIQHNVVTAYRPSANGLVESKNKQIISILRMLVADAPTDWSDKLQIATTALNTAYNRAIGDNPFYLVYCKDITYPYETFLNERKRPFYNIDNYRDYLVQTTQRMFDLVKYALEQTTKSYQTDYDIHFRTRQSTLGVGDRVYVKRRQINSKLDSKYIGPFRIMNRHHDKLTIKSLYDKQVKDVHLSHVICMREDELARETNNEVIPQVYPDKPTDF